MKKNRKYLLAAIALMFVFAIGATIAYLTDTDTATNTFTLGNVDITLTEPNWVANDAQGIVPGAVVAKDPKITNVGSSSAFVFMKVVEPCYNNKKLFTYTVDSAWTAFNGVGTCAANTGVSSAETIYVYGTANSLTPLTASSVTPAIFSNVTLDSTLTSADVTAIGTTTDLNIVVTGYGIQTENVGTTATAVWANFS